MCLLKFARDEFILILLNKNLNLNKIMTKFKRFDILNQIIR
jgi:hypothetical protein